MLSLFYPKLAWSGIRRNARFYVPYLLSGIFMVAMDYIALYLSGDTASQHQETYGILSIMVFVIAIVSFIFLLYSNSILIKERKREFGLFNVLGMEKRHIAMILFVETVITLAIVLVVGLASGILLSKLGTLLLANLMSIGIEMGFSVSVSAILMTSAFFIGIYLLTLVKMVLQVQISNPIQMLHSAQMGERQPKTRWVPAILGLISLGAGYALALCIRNPIDAIMVFFLAVLFVVLGTYLLFMAASIAVLKMLRKRKSYYYRPNHFFSISGMIHRVKRNSVGLATICILSTMVLVIVSTTIALYAGVDHSVKERYPHDIEVAMATHDSTPADLTTAKQHVLDVAREKGRTVSNIETQTTLEVTMVKTADGYEPSTTSAIAAENGMRVFSITTADEYSARTGKEVTLAKDTCLVYCHDGFMDADLGLFGMTFKPTSLDTYPFVSGYENISVPICYVVVADDAVLRQLYAAQFKAFGEKSASTIQRTISFDIDGTSAQKTAYYDALSAQPWIQDKCSTTSRLAQYASFYAAYGSLLFVGIFLGLVFLFMTALIIYYKQVSEGYEDRYGFKIMQDVGMTKKEVRSTTHFQVLLVFFLPLVVAVIHTLVCAQDMVGILRLMAFSDIALYVGCVGGVAVIFAAVYVGVYLLTARMYYRIVS